MAEKIFRDLFLGFVRVHILYHAAKETVYGVDLMEELKRHGYQISPGTMYPILHRLEEKGWLRSKRTPVNGKSRRYYQITPSGLVALDLAKKQAKELVDEIMEV